MSRTFIKDNGIRQYCFAIRQMNYRENRKKTNETNLGAMWNILSPILYMIILSTYYQNVIRHEEVENFPVFVFTGITMLSFYTNGTMGIMHSLVGNKSLLTSTKIPIDVFLIQKLIIAFKEMIFSSVALIPLMAFFKMSISWRIIQIIPTLILTVITVYGIGKLLAVVYVYFADIDYFYSILMTMMLFVSGAFIPLNYMPEKIQHVMTFNPIFLSIYLTRNSLTYNLPSHWTAWVKLSIWALSMHIIGCSVLKNKKSGIINRL